MKEALIYIFIMGVQLFLIKLCSKHLPWQSLLLFVWCFAFIIILTFVLFSKQIVFNNWTLVALIGGALAGIGTIIMYQIIKTKDLGSFSPMLHLVPLISVLLSFAFLSEPVTIKKIAAVICGIAIVFLLN